MTNLKELCENVKMGREYALLGNYDTAMVYYQVRCLKVTNTVTIAQAGYYKFAINF